MNNCLVTKLKSTVNNEGLSKLNVLTIKTKAIDSPTVNTQWLNLSASGRGSISINSPSVGLYQSGISGELRPYPITLPANGPIDTHCENKDGIIEITNKYNIGHIAVGNNLILRIKEIYGIPGTIKKLILSNIEEGEVDATKLVNAMDLGKLTTIKFPYSPQYDVNVNVVNKLSKNRAVEFAAINDIEPSFCALFDNLTLDDITNNINIKSIMMFYHIGPGRLSSLAKMTKLELVTFSDKVQNTGDLVDFINPWIQAGRTSGKIKVSWLLGQKNIKLNGQPITYPSGVDNSLAYLNWTSDGTVTFTAS